MARHVPGKFRDKINLVMTTPAVSKSNACCTAW